MGCWFLTEDEGCGTELSGRELLLYPRREVVFRSVVAVSFVDSAVFGNDSWLAS